MAERATATLGPPITGTVEEVRGRFASEAAMERAIANLRATGFDHADLSIASVVPKEKDTPEGGAAPVTTEDDARQMRALHGGMAGAIGAMVAGGVVAASGEARPASMRRVGPVDARRLQPAKRRPPMTKQPVTRERIAERYHAETVHHHPSQICPDKPPHTE
jgi:hypothetical protein